MLRHVRLVFAAVLVLGLTLAITPSLMAANDNPDEGSVSAAAAVPGVKAQGGGRLLVLVDKDATGYIVRSKGVAEVTHPATGDWCIKPQAKWKVEQAVPVVSVEYSLSSGYSLLAFWRSYGSGCPAGNIEVYTYDFSSGTPVMSDNVAFTVFVP